MAARIFFQAFFFARIFLGEFSFGPPLIACLVMTSTSATMKGLQKGVKVESYKIRGLKQRLVNEQSHFNMTGQTAPIKPDIVTGCYFVMLSIDPSQKWQ
jgi:hypothetical protein